METQIHDYVLFYDRDVKRWVVVLRDKDGNGLERTLFKHQQTAAEYGLEKTGVKYA